MSEKIQRKQKIYVASFGLGIFLIFASCFLLGEKKKSDFSIELICSPFAYDSKWQIEELSQSEKMRIVSILSQKFNYLGSGAQCYAFLSEDGKYVLKFFRMKHLIPKIWLKYIPLPGLEDYRFRKVERRILRKNALFSSYKMAYEKLKEEAALIYIHLNKTDDLHIKAKLFDKMRKCFLVNLDDFEFVLQERAQLVRDHISALMQKGDLEGAVEAIHALLNQTVVQCQRGYVDKDSGISHNYGFVGDRIVHFDVGRIMYDEAAKEPALYQREVLRVGKKLESWLEAQYPMLLPYLEECIDSLITPS